MNMETVGKKLRERRKAVGIPQRDLVEIAGISERTLRAIERGVGNPELSTLLKICDVLGMNLLIEVNDGSGSASRGL